MNFWDFLFGTVAWLFFLWLVINKWLNCKLFYLRIAIVVSEVQAQHRAIHLISLLLGVHFVVAGGAVKSPIDSFLASNAVQSSSRRNSAVAAMSC